MSQLRPDIPDNAKIRNNTTGNVGVFGGFTRSNVIIRFGPNMTVYVPLTVFDSMYSIVEE